MSQYATLDAAILARLHATYGIPLGMLLQAGVWREATRISKLTDREAYRIIDGRLQALRKRGLIEHRTGPENGWRLTKPEAP